MVLEARYCVESSDSEDPSGSPRRGEVTGGATTTSAATASTTLITARPLLIARTAIATQSAATAPITPRKGTPVTASASSATRTVDPAKSTALPDVPLASAMDSITPMPARS